MTRPCREIDGKVLKGSDELQARIVPDVRQLLTEIGERGQAVPGADQVIAGGGEEPRRVDRFAPVGPADLGDGIAAGEQAEIPCATETDEEIYPVGQGAEGFGDFRVRVERAVNPGGHRETPG